MIEVENLSKVYDSGFALQNINLSITQGEKVSIFGPNGAGKTTFFRLLSCLTQPTSGSFTVSGIYHRKRVDILKRLGFATQSGQFYETLTVAQNLEFYGTMYGLEKRHARERIEELLRFFNLSVKIDEKVSSLSKGMRQRLMIIKALIHDPEVLLLDEPFSGLDLNSAKLLSDFIEGLTDKTILIATHDFETGVIEGRRILIFDNGSLGFDGIWTKNPGEFKNFYRQVTGTNA